MSLSSLLYQILSHVVTCAMPFTCRVLPNFLVILFSPSSCLCEDSTERKTAHRTREDDGRDGDSCFEPKCLSALSSFFLLSSFPPSFAGNCYSVLRLVVPRRSGNSEPARFLTRMKSESINKKEAVELECSATGDSPIEISWSKEDKVIKEAKERFL